MDIDDLVASIICSIDNSCGDGDEPTIPISVTERLQAALSEHGGILFGRSGAGGFGDFVCWNAGADAENARISCAPTGKLREASHDSGSYQ